MSAFLWGPLLPGGSEILAGSSLSGAGGTPSVTGAATARSGYGLSGEGTTPSVTGAANIVRQYFASGAGTVPSVTGFGQFSSVWTRRSVAPTAAWAADPANTDPTGLWSERPEPAAPSWSERPEPAVPTWEPR